MKNKGKSKDLNNVKLAIVVVLAVALIGYVVLSMFDNDSTSDAFGSATSSSEISEVVQSVSPSGTIEVSANMSFDFTITALSGASIYITVGDEQITAVESESSSTYSTYIATVTTPTTLEEINLIGDIVLTSEYDGDTIETVIAYLVCESVEETTEKMVVGNYVESNSTTVGSLDTVAGTGTFSEYFSNDVCIITANYADIRYSTTSTTDHIPYISAMVNGTMDYIVDTVDIYDSSSGEYISYYNLASGYRVKVDDSEIIDNVSLDYNTMQVASSVSEGGETTITFDTNWEVPYTMSFESQDYYTSGTVDYHVSDFDAQTITFTFYHTTSINGTIDVSGSDVVSSASVVTSVSDETVTITMPLYTQGEFFGYTLEYNDAGQMMLTIQNTPDSLTDAVIVLDPGHGGYDSGSLGIHSTVYESTINLILAAKVKEELESMGATVLLTRYDDTYVSLEDRKSISQGYDADLFISIHANGSEYDNDYGVAAYYYKAMSYELASTIYDEMLDTFKNVLYAGETSLWSGLDDGVMYYPFSVNRLEDCPSVLLEVGYMTNYDECSKLMIDSNSDALAEAIATGVQNYFNLYA